MRLRVLTAALLLALAACSGEPAAPPGPQAPAVEAGALQAAVRDARVRRFYEARQWRPAWTQEAEASLNAALGEADDLGADASEGGDGEYADVPPMKPGSETGAAHPGDEVDAGG